MFSRRDSLSEIAIVKQKAVDILWQTQQETVSVLQRCMLADGITEEHVNRLRQKLHSLRQSLQDEFLIVATKQSAEEKSQIAYGKFNQEAEKCLQETISIERNMTPQERVSNLNRNFISLFKNLESNEKYNKDSKAIRAKLQSQIELFAGTLKKNIDDQSLRPNIKEKLLHELVDDYYHEIQKIYSDAVAVTQRT